MGARTTKATLTENRDGSDPAGVLYIGIDVGRRSHMVAAVSRQRMEDGSWEHVAPRRFPTTGDGYRNLIQWLASPLRVNLGRSGRARRRWP